MLKEFFPSSTRLWESHLHHRKFLHGVKVAVLFPKQNKTKPDLLRIQSLGMPAVLVCDIRNAKVLEKGELLPIVEDAPIPIRELLETAGVNPAQRGDAEAAPICSEEQNLLLVYLTQTRASCLL